MKRRGKLFCFFLGLALLFAASTPLTMPVAADGDNGATALTFGDFTAAFQGGASEITLAADLVVDENTLLQGDMGTPVRVDMGQFGIVIPDGFSLFIDSPVQFTGEGDRAKFIVEGNLRLGDSGSMIAVEGDHAMAVLLRQSGQYSGGSILARGKGAVALSSEKDTLSLYSQTIRAEGEGSVAIQGVGQVRLTQCVVTGGQASVTAPAVYTDSCSLTPAADNVSIASRRIGSWLLEIWESPEGYIYTADLARQGVLVAQGGTVKLPAAVSVECLMEGTIYEDYIPEQFQVPVSWQLPSGFTTAVPGVYTARMIPAYPLQMAMVEKPEYLDVPIRVIGPDEPYLVCVDEYIAPNFYVIPFFNPIDNPDAVRVYCSEKLGEWTEVTGSATVVNSAVILPKLKSSDAFYLFSVTVESGRFYGASNAVSFLSAGDVIPSEALAAYNARVAQRPRPSLPGATDPSAAQTATQPTAALPPAPSPGGSGSARQYDSYRDYDPTEPTQTATAPTAPAQTQAPAPAQTAAQPKGAAAATGGAQSATTPIAEPPVPLSSAPTGSGPTVLTGDMIRKMLEIGPSALTFFSGGLRMIVPSEVLESLNLAGEENLRAEMEMRSRSSFTVRLYTGNIRIVELEHPFEVHVPYALDSSDSLSDIYCADSGGNRYDPTGYRDGMLIFPLYSSGAYQIVNADQIAPAIANLSIEKAPAARPAIPLPSLLLPLLAGIALLVGGAWFLVRFGSSR